MRLFSKLSQLIWIRFASRVSNYIQRILHRLGWSLQKNISILLFLINLKIFQHLSLLLVKYFFSLFINHFAGTTGFLIIVDCRKPFLLRAIIYWRRRWFIWAKSSSYRLIPTFLLIDLLLSTFLFFVCLRTLLSLYFTRRILLEGCPGFFYEIIDMQII